MEIIEGILTLILITSICLGVLIVLAIVYEGLSYNSNNLFKDLVGLFHREKKEPDPFKEYTDLSVDELATLYTIKQLQTASNEAYSLGRRSTIQEHLLQAYTLAKIRKSLENEAE